MTDKAIAILDRYLKRGKQQQTLSTCETVQIRAALVESRLKEVEYKHEIMELQAKYNALKCAVINKFVKDNC